LTLQPAKEARLFSKHAEKDCITATRAGFSAPENNNYIFYQPERSIDVQLESLQRGKESNAEKLLIAQTGSEGP
jgi:hypothetical protein